MNELVNYLKEHISLARHMDIRSGQETDKWLELIAPISENQNDKQTAFGGSIATLCTLAGWCASNKISLPIQHKIDVAVLESQIRYRLPVTSDLICARAYFPSSDQIEQYLSELEHSRRAKIRIDATIMQNNKKAVIYNGLYQAKI